MFLLFFPAVVPQMNHWSKEKLDPLIVQTASVVRSQGGGANISLPRRLSGACCRQPSRHKATLAGLNLTTSL